MAGLEPAGVEASTFDGRTVTVRRAAVEGTEVEVGCFRWSDGKTGVNARVKLSSAGAGAQDLEQAAIESCARLFRDWYERFNA